MSTLLDHKSAAAHDIEPIRWPVLAAKPKTAVPTIADWMHYALKAAVEATVAIAGDGGTSFAAEAAGTAAYRANMPPLTSRQNIRAYIACIEQGLRGGWMTHLEAVPLIRCATAALAAHPRRDGSR